MIIDTCAEARGYIAYWDGQARSRNAYPRETCEWYYWNLGHRLAEMQDEEDQEEERDRREEYAKYG